MIRTEPSEPSGLSGPTAAEIERSRRAFVEIGVAQLADAASDVVRVVGLDLRPRTAQLRVCGPAFPVYTDNDMLPCLQALAAVPAGWVVVLVNRASESEALVGDIYTVAAQEQGVGGVVVAGAARDLADIAAMTIPVFSTSVTYVSARTTDRPARQVPEPVTIGGALLAPGDWIFGDPDGFLVVDAAAAGTVLLGGRVLRDREEKLKAALRQGRSLSELTGLPAFLAGEAPLGFAP